MGVVRFASIIVCTALAILLGLPQAQASKRVALVIGNSSYHRVGKLANPANDAKVISRMLQSMGFDAVQLHENLGIREMRQAINDFADIVRDADIGVVYYSGHGMEVNGINYLIPIDAMLDRDSDVPYETVSLDNLVQLMEPTRRLRLVMLDACRDNPFARTMKRTVGSRALGRGLAPVEPASVNTLIGYAAKAGSIALDGDNANSPYALALQNHMPTPGLDLRIAFGRVRDEVLSVTRGRQEPFVYGSLGGGTVSLVEGPESSGSTPSQTVLGPLLDRAGQAWLATKDTASSAVLEDFIRQFGTTPYGSMARARLEELRASMVPKPMLAPATPPDSQRQSTVYTDEAFERVLNFLEQYHIDAEKDINYVEKYYADAVLYYSKGMITRTEIMKERREIAALCPVRRYTIIRETVDIKELSRNTYSAEFKVYSICHGSKKNSESTWLNSVTIDFSGVSAKIIALSGSKLN